MVSYLIYIGPGLGVGTIVLVFIVLVIVLAAFLMILWTPVKNLIRKISSLFSRN